MITLYLHGVVHTSRADLEAFLARALPTYEAPGGIRTRLQWDLDDERRFVEIIEYADRRAYDADQVRIDEDPDMVRLLAEWRTHLVGPVRVEAFEESDLARP